MQWTADRLGDPGRGSDSYLGSLGTNALEKPGLKSSLKNLSRLKKQVTAPRTTTVVAHSQPCGSLLTATRQVRCYKGKLTAQKGPCRLLAFSVSSDFPPSSPTTPQASTRLCSAPSALQMLVLFQDFIVKPLLFLFCALCLGELISSQSQLPQTHDQLPNGASDSALSWPPKPLASDRTHSLGTSKSRPKQIHHLTALEHGLPSLVPRPMAHSLLGGPSQTPPHPIPTVS